MSLLLTAVAASIVTLLVMLVLLNLRSTEPTLDYSIQTRCEPGDPHFCHIMSQLLGPPIVGGNRVIALVNGKEIFPAMLEAIASAQESITLETYIYWSGKVGQQFADALSDRAQNGVKVHILLDYIGCQRMDEKLIQQMRGAGCEVNYFHPVRWYNLAKMNHRTHRKLLVVDGRIGFNGGVGIADEWDGDATGPNEYRDSHFQCEGPVVAQLQAAFMDNWLKTRAEVLQDKRYFPELEQVGTVHAQVFKSSPQEGSASARLMFMLSIAAAHNRLLLGNAYFVPDRLAQTALIHAARRGVRVQLVLPGPYTDMRVVRSASRRRYGKLLRAGVEIYEYQPAFYHCKLLVVDGCWVSVGSANFDTRSFRLNDEANLNVLDEGFAATLTEQMERDLAHCKRILMKDWKERPKSERVAEFFSDLLRYQL